MSTTTYIDKIICEGDETKTPKVTVNVVTEDYHLEDSDVIVTKRITENHVYFSYSDYSQEDEWVRSLIAKYFELR